MVITSCLRDGELKEQKYLRQSIQVIGVRAKYVTPEACGLQQFEQLATVLGLSVDSIPALNS